MNIFIRLFWEFFKTGLFSVGGGMATLPFLYDMSDRLGWFTHGELADMLAVSESTPGPIGVNMATFVGFRTGGIAGAIVATLGLVLPSFLVILIVILFMRRFRDSPRVNAAFYGLRPASVALIASAGISIVMISLFDIPAWQASGVFADLFQWRAMILAAVLWVLTNLVKPLKKLHPLWFILASAIIGIVGSFAKL